MESMSSSMGFFQPMNSEDFASNFSSACEQQHHLPQRVETGGTESPLFVGKLGRYVQVRSPKPSGSPKITEQYKALRCGGMPVMCLPSLGSLGGSLSWACAASLAAR